MRAIALLGRDWPELGPLALEALEGGGALALSRGAQPKAYKHEDPNEDAALAARLPGGVLLAVADGFNGFRAAELAIERTRARAAELLAARGAAFRAAVGALLADVAERLPRDSRSHSCLVVATLRDTRCELASFGDAFAFRAGSHAPLLQPNTLLVGRGPAPRERDAARWHLSFERAPGERVALCSDGVVNFMRDPSEIPDVLAKAESDLDCARALARAALDGGAGDNLAVAAFSGDTAPRAEPA